MSSELTLGFVIDSETWGKFRDGAKRVGGSGGLALSKIFILTNGILQQLMALYGRSRVCNER
jgi:hypothetical protein